MTATEPKIFISYARKDGEKIARNLLKKFEELALPTWLDRFGLEGGKDWWLQIEEAIQKVDFLVLVASPAALESEYVAKEWHYARRQGVCVYPVKDKSFGDIKFGELPVWMSKLHFYDLELEWDSLLQHLKKQCLTVKVPFTAPSRRAAFVENSAYHQAIEILLNRRTPIITLQGLPGSGKRALAINICHNEQIQNLYSDGVLWISIGGQFEPKSVLKDQIELLTGIRPNIEALDILRAKFAEIIRERSILIVLENAWDQDAIRELCIDTNFCSYIITTRVRSIGIINSQYILSLNLMNDSESLELLSNYIGTYIDPTIPKVNQLLGLLGGWPILIELCAAQIRSRITSGDSLANSTEYVIRALEKRGVTAFDHSHNSVREFMDINIQFLTDEEKQKFYRLGLFKSTHIPILSIQRLWDMDNFETEELLQKLHNLSLIELDFKNRQVYIQEIVAAFGLERLGNIEKYVLDLFD